MTQFWRDVILGAVIGLVVLVFFCVFAHAATVRLGDCAVFPPAPVHVIHRPHHFAHHRAPVCHCDEQLGGPAGGAPGDGFSFNNGGNGDEFSQGDAGGVGAGGGGSSALAAASGLLFFSDDGILGDVRVGGLGKGNGPPGGFDSPNPTVIPEPSTLALVAIGAGALLLKWRVS